MSERHTRFDITPCDHVIFIFHLIIYDIYSIYCLVKNIQTSIAIWHLIFSCFLLLSFIVRNNAKIKIFLMSLEVGMFLLLNIIFYKFSRQESYLYILTLALLVYIYVIVSSLMLLSCLVSCFKPRLGDDINDGYNILDNQNDKLSTDDIIKMKTYIYKNEKENISGTKCSICIEDFLDESILKILNCRHSFHTNCIDGWLQYHASCPMCRKIINLNDISDEYKTAKTNNIP